MNITSTDVHVDESGTGVRGDRVPLVFRSLKGDETDVPPSRRESAAVGGVDVVSGHCEH